MPVTDLPGGVRSGYVSTPRLRHHVLLSGAGDGPVVVFVHGNLSQLRAVLERARAAGGSVTEEEFADCGHSPHLEYPGRFRDLLVSFVTAAGR